jgi:hypothetical protein
MTTTAKTILRFEIRTVTDNGIPSDIVLDRAATIGYAEQVANVERPHNPHGVCILDTVDRLIFYRDRTEWYDDSP